MEKKSSWVCTVIIQVALCFALYYAINIGQPQTPTNYQNDEDIYFISVQGGFRPLKQQTHLLKLVNISSGRTLDIITLKTGKTQDSSSGIGEVQLKQLSRKLELSNSNWHIAAGFHPLFCNQSLEGTQKESHVLHQMLLKHGVDVYLSGQSCAKKARIGGPYLTTTSQGSYPSKKLANSFLLHRVSPLEIATYGVSFKGNIIHESTIRQRGGEAM